MKRIVVLIVSVLVSITTWAKIENGSCGENLTWTYDTETQELSIQGSGEMENYSYSWNVPWNSFDYEINKVILTREVTSICDYAFNGCSKLSSITIPSSVTSIGDYAFDGCSKLSSITIPSSVTSIGDYAFRGCSSLTSITIPNNVTSIGNEAFGGCSSLASISVASGNTVFDSRNNCNAIIKTSTNELVLGCKNTIIPNNVTSIGNNAFGGCSRLTSITIPSSVTSIGGYAFYYCGRLTSIIIPNSVTSIGDNAFGGCGGLTKLRVEEGNPVYDSRESCNAIINTQSNKLIRGCSATIIPNGVISIGAYAFDHCNSLTSIAIPNSVTSIGAYAFDHCNSLTSIAIPNSVTSIGKSAFSNCSGLTSITISQSVTSIGDYVFYYCSKLSSISIPNSVLSIGSCAFSNCSGLTSITIPSSVTLIGDYAFDGCSKLSSITIPNSVTSIGSNAFSYCGNLNSVIIEGGVSNIGKRAFYKCNNLRNVYVLFSDNSLKIYDDTFIPDKNLTIFYSRDINVDGHKDKVKEAISKLHFVNLSKDQLNIRLPYADYIRVTLSNKYDSWLEKDEFEKTFEYHQRVNDVTKVVVKDSIINAATQAYIAYHARFAKWSPQWPARYNANLAEYTMIDEQYGTLPLYVPNVEAKEFENSWNKCTVQPTWGLENGKLIVTSAEVTSPKGHKYYTTPGHLPSVTQSSDASSASIQLNLLTDTVLWTSKQSLTLRYEVLAHNVAASEIQVESTVNGRDKQVLSNIDSVIVTIPDRNGVHYVTLQAYSQRHIMSAPKDIRVHYTRPTESTIHILAVGTSPNNPHDLKPLRYTVHDAEGFADAISNCAEKSKSYPGGIKKYVLTDSLASDYQINSAFDSLMWSVKKNDVVVLYFAGHGRDGNYLAYNWGGGTAGTISFVDDIQKQSNRLANNKNCHVLLFMDVCSSGMLAKGSVDLLQTPPAVMGFYSCSDEEKALELERLQHGVFTYVLLKALSGGAYRDEKMDCLDLETYLKTEIKKYSGQSPKIENRLANQVVLFRNR